MKLRFASTEQAQQARDLLSQSDQVLNVAPNLWYEPAVIYRMRSVVADAVRGTYLSAPLAAPFVKNVINRLEAKGVSMPEVQLPSGNVVTGADPMLDQDWALKSIRMDQVSKVTADPQMLTAVIDTGVDYNHEDLIRAMWRKPGQEQEVGYDFAHGNTKPFDSVHYDMEGCYKDFLCRLGLNLNKYLVNPGHGTHCAGHVAAVYNNSLGIRGVGAGAKIMALKFFYDFGEPSAGRGDDSAAIQSIDYAIKNGARIISASWGGRVRRDDAEKSELKQALIRAQSAGVLVVIAAGNDGVNQDEVSDPSFPAAYDLDNVITVAAVDQNDGLADFSNYGAKSVHIAAPGVKIFSTTSGNGYGDVIAKFTDASGKSHQTDWNGTSMATPIVAGAAALVWSKYPKADYREVRDRLLRSVRRVAALEGKIVTGGVLDVAAALR